MKHPWIERHALHAHAIAEQCASGKRRRRIYGNHSNRETSFAKTLHQERG